jgi:hypothetical protein
LLAVVLSGSRLGQEAMEMQGGAGVAAACLGGSVRALVEWVVAFLRFL